MIYNAASTLNNLSNNDLIEMAKNHSCKPHRSDGPAVDFLQTVRNVVVEMIEEFDNASYDYLIIDREWDDRLIENVMSSKHLIYPDLTRSTFTDLNPEGEISGESFTAIAEGVVYEVGLSIAKDLTELAEERWTDMLKWFRKIRAENEPSVGHASGVRNDSDAEYRRRRIAEITAKSTDLNPEAKKKQAQILDSWAIEKVLVNDSVSWLASPLWDDEAMMTRDTFPTRDDAIDYVAAIGGNLAPDLLSSEDD